MNIPYIIERLYPKADFLSNVSLVNAGDGIEIEKWELDAPKPSIAELEKRWPEFERDYQARVVQINRAPKYPPVGDQLDAILKQLKKMADDGSITPEADLLNVMQEWQKVKTDHPK